MIYTYICLYQYLPTYLPIYLSIYVYVKVNGGNKEMMKSNNNKNKNNYDHKLLSTNRWHWFSL